METVGVLVMCFVTAVVLLLVASRPLLPGRPREAPQDFDHEEGLPSVGKPRRRPF
jgi:hypothetical protein